MDTYTYNLGGDDCLIHFPTTQDDMRAFADWFGAQTTVLGADTETSGLDIFTPNHRLRLFQVGNRDEAWVINMEIPEYRAQVVDLIARYKEHRYTFHNAPYDRLTMDRHEVATLEQLRGRVEDTHIYAHLLDPRLKMEGGTGLSVKDLAAVYVDPNSPDTGKGLVEVFRKEYKATKATGWALIDINHPTYVLYAGLDALFAARLYEQVTELVRRNGLSELAEFEHRLSECLMEMQRRGVLVDGPYVEQLSDELAEEAEKYRKIAARYGVENVNSTAQIAEALLAMGETLTEKTPKGKWKVDSAVMQPIADLDNFWNRIGAREPNRLADAVVRAKRAEKWRTAYAEAFLTLRDASGRVHPMIGGLQARTARMSISHPPLQQLPSSDWKIRRGLIADPGHAMIASDYAQVEMRVLAALSGDKRLQDAIKGGVDLHDYTATLVYGEDFTAQDRKLMKGVGFGKVYGGGATTLARQTGAPIAKVRGAIKAYDRTYPGIKRYSRKLMQRADFGKREVVTPSGRHLPLDRDRLYAATNYVVQSTARDVIAQAIIRIFDAGLGDGLLLPVHDELIGQAPIKDAEEYAREIGRHMDLDFFGIPITSEPEVIGASWGHGYGAEV